MSEQTTLRPGGGHRPRHVRPVPNRRRLMLAGLLAAVLAAAGGTGYLLRPEPRKAAGPAAPPVTAPAQAPLTPSAIDPAGDPASAPAGSTAAGPECRYEIVPGEDTAPVPAARASVTPQPVRVTLDTNRGPITMELDPARAPCTVHSFLNLAAAEYFTDSACHRLTTAGIFVLQCGDPTATGSGTPGYRFADENLPVGVVPAYPRGTLAMANAGPGTNGAQFFLVYRDSDIDPNFPVFGRVTGGLEVLDAVATAGAPNNDGTPNSELVIQAVLVG